MVLVRKEQYISVRAFAEIVHSFAENQLDGLICVAGERGLGKSVFTRLFIREYCVLISKPFDLAKYTYYSKESFDRDIETNEARQIFFLDEAITVLFNRERMEDLQVDLIKKLNICRYKEHLILALVPRFFDLDKGVRDLARVLIHVDKRPINGNPGFAHIFMKDCGVFASDPWHRKNNEKLRSAFHKSPNYWGTIIIPDHSKEPWFVKMEEEALKIKDEKKLISKEDVGFKWHRPTVKRLVRALKEGGYLEGVRYRNISELLGINYNSFRDIMSCRTPDFEINKKLGGVGEILAEQEGDNDE